MRCCRPLSEDSERKAGREITRFIRHWWSSCARKMLILGAGGDADGLLLRAVLEIIQLVRGARGVPAVTIAELGSQRRTRAQTFPASSGGSCPYTFDQTRACSRDKCQNGGTPHSSSCSCRSGYQRTCCEGGNSLCTDFPPPLGIKSGEETSVNRRR